MSFLDRIFHPKNTSHLAEYDEAAAIIEAFVENRAGKWDWDEFTSIKKKDVFLESVRVRCVSVFNDYPAKEAARYCSPEGFEVLRGLAKELRGKTSSVQAAAGA
jgi:hypothetical protein